MADLEKILVYLGPSLSLARAREILPDAIYRPPAKQGDLVTHVVNENPAWVQASRSMISYRPETSRETARS